MIDKPVIDLPQPDSPTRPSVSPGSMLRLTLPTAWTTDRLSWMCVDRSLISMTGGIRVGTSQVSGGSGQRRRSRTSRESRSASPIRLQAMTTSTIDAPTG